MSIKEEMEGLKKVCLENFDKHLHIDIFRGNIEKVRAHSSIGRAVGS